MLLLGIDIGTSAVKVSIVDSNRRTVIVSAQYPERESPIIALQTGWAEQSPDMWWEQTVQAIALCHKKGGYNPKDIAAIGIAYQMHGLVLVDKNQNVLRNSIIWCDSRAVQIGNKAFEEIGNEVCLSHMLNSPGNFTASKLAWVKNNEPELYKQIDKIMLPGDYIAMRLTGEITTSASALSEGIFYDFQTNGISADITSYFDFDRKIFASMEPVFSEHGKVTAEMAAALQLKQGIPVSYKAGDQPNNALSLNVLKPGEVAATAGTSGVIYGVTDQLAYDLQSRVNTFAHVNHSEDQKRLGVLLCINGTGSLYRWIKDSFAKQLSYAEMNAEAEKIPIGSDGLRILPFGNGAERMLNNKTLGAEIANIDLNLHTPAHIFRAAQEGIACAFRYGLDILRENGMSPTIIKASKTNMFLSEVFAESFVNATGVPVELYHSDGSLGAAIGAGIGAKLFTIEEAFTGILPVENVEPQNSEEFEEVYQSWKMLLERELKNIPTV